MIGISNAGYFRRKKITKISNRFAKSWQQVPESIHAGTQAIIADLKGTEIAATFTGEKWVSEYGFLNKSDVKKFKPELAGAK